MGIANPPGWSNLFGQRIANPPKRLTGLSFQGVGISVELMLLSYFSLFVLFCNEWCDLYFQNERLNR